MSEGFVPPQEVRNNAKRGLELRKEHGRGGTEVGVARARDLSNGKALSLETINRMISYFARHEVDKKGEGWGKDSAGYIAWLLWGGDAGRAWATRVKREQENKEKSTMTDLTTSYFGIEKADKHADGTLTVYGKATDDALDIDKQICDGDWLDRAMPHWFKSGGNIREQHSNIAAGVAKEYELKADGHYITALVVDPVSVKKVENGVLKGFSIGIKNPRVIQDSKAANGRIVDGQIVEVSLVDRPANPNCQLVLAKSASGEETIIQVEELVELLDKTEQETDAMEKTITVSVPKSIVGDIVKFDKAQFEAARNALASLIAVEAEEIKEGHNELMSISHLLEAVAHLHAWYEGEEAEGEVMEEMIELSAHTDKEMMPKKGETKSSYMKRCKEAGMDDETIKAMCDKYMSAEKSADISKCLECGCNQVGSNHGVTTTNDFANVATPSNVSTAQIITPAETPKSAEADEVVAEETTEEAPAVEETPTEETPAEEAPVVEEVTEEAPKVSAEDISDAEVEAIVEEAIKSATKSIKSEVALLVSAKEAALSKVTSLESELAIAKSLAVAGGPKRTGTSQAQPNDLLVKAATYKAKAEATTDPVLAKGYKELAKEFFAKSAEASK
jgi:hypothetical protein